MASKYASRKPLIVLLCSVIISGVTSIAELEITNPPRDAYALKDASLVLDCTTAGQRPIAVIWRREGVEINLNGERVMLANNSLLINSVLPKKDAGSYQCCASNDYGTICSSEVTVTIAILPRFDVHPEPSTVLEGGTARFVCHTQAAPSPTISWKHDRRTLDPTVDTRVTVLPDGILQIIDVTPDDAGDYRCIAVNIADKRRSQPAALVVEPRIGGGPDIIDEPQIKAGPVPLTKVFGEMAIFECLVDGDESLEVSWSKQDGRAIRTQGVYYTARQNLHINSVTTSDAGAYVCRATNTITGFYVERMAELTVYDPPIIVDSPQTVSGPVAINARFSCVAEGFPLPQIQWLHNGWRVEQSGRYSQKPNDDLVISGVWPDDDGVIQCVAKNEAGVSLSSTRLEVKGSPNPVLPPRHIRGIVFDSTTILVTWMPPLNSADEVIAYTLHYQPTEGGIEIQKPVGADTLSYRVDELEPFTTYTFYLQCWTSQGPSNPSERTNLKTKEAPPVRAPAFTLSSNSPDTITIQWQPLSEHERNGIVKTYKIICNIHGGETETERTWEVNGALTYFTISDLQEDTLYMVRMAAKTMEYGPLSEWVSVRTWVDALNNQSTPRAPSMELNTPNPTSIQVNVGPPTMTTVILGYKVFYKLKRAGAVEVGPTVLPVMVTEHTITPLEEATTYEVRALAYNRHGDGHSVVQAITTPRSLVTLKPPIYVPPPEVVNLTSLSPRVIRVSWSTPQSSQPIEFYTVKYWHEGNISSALELIVPGNKTRTVIVIKELLPYTSYEFKIRSHTSKGAGPYSEILKGCTLEDRPSTPPSSIVAEPRDAHTIVVQWQPPNQPNGILTHFVIMYNKDFAMGDASWKQEERNGSARSANVEGLNSDTIYYFKVRAGTQAGEGPPTNVIEAQTLEAPPAYAGHKTRDRGILIGIFLALSCIICCSVFIFCKRRVLCSQNYSPHVVSQPVNGNGPPLRYSVNGGMAKVYMANTNGEDADTSFTPMLSHLPEPPVILDTKGGSPLIINGDGPVHGPYISKGLLPRGDDHPPHNHCHGSLLDLEDGGSTSLSSSDPDGSGTALLATEVKQQHSQEQLHDSGTEIPMSSLDKAATNTQDLGCHSNSCSGNTHTLNQELPHNPNCPLLLASSKDTGVHSDTEASRHCDIALNNLPQQIGSPVTTSGVNISSDSGSPQAKSSTVLLSSMSPHRKEPVRLKHSTGKVLPHRSPSMNDTMVPLEDIWERRCTLTPTTQATPLPEPSSSSSSTTPTTSATTNSDSSPSVDDSPKYSPSLTFNTSPDILRRTTPERSLGRGASKTCTV